MSTPPPEDYRVIRDLARRVAEIAALPQQEHKALAWRRFNRLQADRPMVLIFPEGAWREVPLELVTTDPFCRRQEWNLRSRIYYHEHLKDDNVVSDVVHCPLAVKDTGYGISEQQQRPQEATGAAHFEPVIVREEDFARLVRKPQVTVDWEESQRQYRKTCELYDGILPVAKGSPGLHTYMAVVDLFAKWRGLEQLLWDLADRPAWVHRCLQFLTDGHIEVLDSLERLGALRLNNGANYVGSGGVGFSDELPQKDFDGEHVRPMDLWGFATTQIFAEVSPAMHEEFALRYEIPFLSRFGLNCYGCCEPLHRKMDAVKKIPRLRRVSMSPWVDLDRAAAELGDRYVFSRKPNPAALAAVTWDGESIRRSIRDDLQRTRGCVVELVMKDTHTVNGCPQRLADWVRIAKEEAERFAA